MNELEEKRFIKRVGERQARKIYVNPYLFAGGDIKKDTKKEIDNAGYKPVTPY